MRTSVLWAVVATTSWSGCHEATPATPPPSALSAPAGPADEGALYALGAMLGKNIQDLELTPAEVEAVKSGLADQALRQPLKFELATFGPKAEQLGQARHNAVIQAHASAQKAKDQPFLEAAGKESGARILEGGLVKRTLVEGQGSSPTSIDQVRLSYQGALADGTVFDTTDKRGGDARRPLNGLIPCLSRGLQTMKVGEKARLVCPPSLGYGDRGRPPAIPGGATLVFEAQLLEINPPQPPAPPHQHGKQPHPEPGEER